MKKHISVLLGLLVIFSSLFTSCNEEELDPNVCKITVKSEGNGTVSITDYIGTSVNVLIGNRVEVEATPDEGWAFIGWYVSGSESPVSTDAAFTFITSENITLTARFAKLSDIIIRSGGNGSVAFKNASGNSIPVLPGAEVTVIATPNEDCDFVGWFIGDSETPVSTEAVYTFTATENIVLTGQFSKRPVVTVKSAGNGSVSIKDTYWTNKAFLPGTEVTVIAKPYENCDFIGWFVANEESPISTDAEYTFTVTEDITLTAKFSKRPIVTIRSAGNGSVSFKDYDGTSIAVSPNTEVTVIATPDEYSDFVGWHIADSLVSTEHTYVHTVSCDVVLIAKFYSGEYINEIFASSFGVFSTEETVGNYPWVIDYSTAKATSYVDGANNAATSWLISSPVDFTNETEAYVAFDYIIRYAESGKVASYHQLLISTDYAGNAAEATWVDLPYNAVEGSDWATFYKANVAVPAEFLGKSGVVFALRYTATTKAGTWEVKNFKVAHGKAEVVEPEEAGEYTVAEALAAFDGAAKPAVVKGYIVGTVNGQVYTEDCVFSGTAESKTNLLIADNPDETDYNNCIPVQLPSGAVRNALNLVDNPGNYKKMVTLTGSLEKYFGVAGLKSVTAYTIDGTTPETPETPEPEEPETPDTPSVPTEGNILENSSFEEWNGNVPTAWGKDDSNASAHSATISQSTDAYDGSYSVIVNGDAKGNKRLASKCYTLPAGTYSYTIYVKTNGNDAGHCRLGYAPIADGKVGSYVYEEAAASAVTGNWTARTLEFTLAEETTISLVVMNNKTGNGASFLVDNATLVKK